MATDLPVSERQLRRIVRRAGVGLARLGSFIGHGSGEVFMGFTTANRVPANSDNDFISMKILQEDKINTAFRAMAEATEEAVLNSMLMAETVISSNGTIRRSLNEWI